MSTYEEKRYAECANDLSEFLRSLGIFGPNVAEEFYVWLDEQRAKAVSEHGWRILRKRTEELRKLEARVEDLEGLYASLAFLESQLRSRAKEMDAVASAGYATRSETGSAKPQAATGWKPPRKMTAEEIEAGKSPRGGWTHATLKGWGVPIPPPKGWRKRLLSGE